MKPKGGQVKKQNNALREAEHHHPMQTQQHTLCDYRERKKSPYSQHPTIHW